MNIRLANPCYCTTPQSVRWVQQSLVLRRKLTSRRFLKKIQTPVLMLCAQKDTVVSEEAQMEFASKCDRCSYTTVSESTHSMLWGTPETIEEHVQQVIAHFC